MHSRENERNIRPDGIYVVPETRVPRDNPYARALPGNSGSSGTRPEAGTSPGTPGVGETGQSTHPTHGEAPLGGDRSSTEGDRGRQDEIPPEDGLAAGIQKE